MQSHVINMTGPLNSCYVGVRLERGVIVKPQRDAYCSNQKVAPGSTSGTGLVCSESRWQVRSLYTAGSFTEHEWETLHFCCSVRFGANAALLRMHYIDRQFVRPRARCGLSTLSTFSVTPPPDPSEYSPGAFNQMCVSVVDRFCSSLVVHLSIQTCTITSIHPFTHFLSPLILYANDQAASSQPAKQVPEVRKKKIRDLILK